jgi:DNA-binding XRE family transcriptional regulator
MTPDDLRAWRHRLGYSQPQLARIIGVHPQTVRHWERGARTISPLLHLALWAIEHGALSENPSESRSP